MKRDSKKLSPLARGWIEDSDISKRATRNRQTHILDFQNFIYSSLGLELDEIVRGASEGTLDLAKVMDNYAIWSIEKKVNSKRIGIAVLRDRIRCILQFFRESGIDTRQTKEKLDKRLPKRKRGVKLLQRKEEISSHLQYLTSPSLRTFCIFLAALGWKPTQVLWISAEDIDETSDPPVVRFVGRKTKVFGKSRFAYLSREAYREYRRWMAYKHRPRRISSLDRKTGKWTYHYLRPVIRKEEPIFARYRRTPQVVNSAYIANLYRIYRDNFSAFLTTQGYSSDPVSKHRAITFTSFKPPILEVLRKSGNTEFANFYSGKDISAYRDMPRQTRIDLFKKAEPYLTISDRE